MERARKHWLAGLVVLAGSGASLLKAEAATYTADFSATAHWDQTTTRTAFWNTVDQRVQAPPSANDAALDFGDGSDGAFSDGPAQTGITVVGATITINTDTKATFQFSSFALSSGKTLRATGSQPLTLRVLGTTSIVGTIDMQGTAGVVNSLAAVSTGGAAGAGGGAGGNSGVGATSTAGTSGLPAGRGGTVGQTTNSDNGGGGGCNGKDGSNDAAAGLGGGGGAAGACSAASPRTTLASMFESSFAGGAGGGGGGGNTTGGSTVSGASGGGGGGALHIVSLGAIGFGTNPTLGTITVKGGSGGNNTVDDGTTFACGGGGGGGSGGSIWLQSASTIASAGNAGTIDVSKGTGGNDAGACGGPGISNGGDGSLGILRVDATSAVLSGAATTLSKTSAVRSGQTYVIVSKGVDTGSSQSAFFRPTESIDTTSASCGSTGTLSVTYEGSSDAVTWSTGVSGAEISQLDGSRYVRFRVTIATTGTAPPCLLGLSLPYAPLLTDLKLSGGLACGTTGRKGGTPGNLGELALLGLLAWAATRRRQSGPPECG